MVETGVSYEQASKILEKAGYDVVAAIVMAQAGIGYRDALRVLEEAGGIPTRAIELAKRLKASGEIKGVEY